MPYITKLAPGQESLEVLRSLYIKTERKIINEITRKRNLELVDYAEVASLERVQAILREMTDKTDEYIPQVIEKYFYDESTMPGASKGYANAMALTSTQTNISQLLINNLLAQIDEAAGVAYNSASKFLEVGRLEADAFRNLTLEAAAEREASGRGWQTIQNQLAADLNAKGLTSFTDVAGREWSLANYCTMATRTTGRQAQVAAALTADDHDLWQISKIGSTCPLCSVYEGRVYSKSGANPDYPPLAMAFGKIDPAGSNDLSNTYLNIHPNCLHSLVKYTTIGKTDEQIEKDKKFSSFEERPDTTDYRSKRQVKAYREKEAARAKYRQDLKQFEKYKAALGKDMPKTFETFEKHKKLDDDVYKSWEKGFREMNIKASHIKSEMESILPEGITTTHKKSKSSSASTLPARDITKIWTDAKGSTGMTINLQEYTVGDTTYKVDGHNVVLNPSEQEINIANALAVKYGKTVELLPRVNFPQGIQTPDYLIDGKRFDLKSPLSDGKNVLYNLIAKKKKQAPNFIIDVSKCNLTSDEIDKQITGLYNSTHTRFVDEIVVVKDDEVLKVYKRN